MNAPMLIPAAIDDAGLSPKAFRVFATLCRRAGADGRCFPSVDTIATTTGMNRKTVIEALAELVAAGFVERESRAGHSTSYRLLSGSGKAESKPATQPEKRADPENGPARKTDHHPARKTGQGVARKTGHIREDYKGGFKGTPDFPVFTKPEGEVSPDSKADPRHREITSQIGARHQAATGQPVVIAGRDVAALKKFLTTWKGTADEFLAIAEKAWRRGRADSFAKNCTEAASIAGLCQRWPQVLAEHDRKPAAKTSAPKPVSIF